MHLSHGTGTSLFTAFLRGEPIVIKTPRDGLTENEVLNITRELQHEASILAMLDHPNVIKFIGQGTVVLEDNSLVYFMVVESLAGGTLAQQVEALAKTGGLRGAGRVSISVLRTHMTALASAMTYVHLTALKEHVIIHRDLKPDNIGFTEDGTLKVFDFGMCTLIPRERPNSINLARYQLTGQTGSIRYMAPEVATNQLYNQSVDVYSFALISWELAYGKKPYVGMNVRTHHQVVCLGGGRPQLDDRARPAELNRLIAECWSADHTRRPTFESIWHRLVSQGEQGLGLPSPSNSQRSESNSLRSNNSGRRGSFFGRVFSSSSSAAVGPSGGRS